MMPHARFVDMPTLGHDPWFEAPEVFHAVVGEFLSSLPPQKH